MLIFEAVEEFIKARVERNWSPFSPVHCEEIQSLFIDGIEMLSHYLQLFGFLKIPINPVFGHFKCGVRLENPEHLLVNKVTHGFLRLTDWCQ